MITKDNLELYLIRNCKMRISIENFNITWSYIYLPLANPKLDTEYQKRFHNDSIIPSKYYKWHNKSYSFNHVVKRILNDFKKGIINITEFQADNKIQVSARKSTNNNPESKTNGEQQ